MISLIRNLKFRLLLSLFILLFSLFYAFGYAIVHTLENSYKESLDAMLFTVLKDIKYEYVNHPERIETMMNEVKDEFDMPLLYAQVVNLDLRLDTYDITMRSHDLQESNLKVDPSFLHTVAAHSDKIAYSEQMFSSQNQHTVRIGTIFLADQNGQFLFLQCALPYNKHTPQVKNLTVTLWIGFSLLLATILLSVYILITLSFRNVRKVAEKAKQMSMQTDETLISKTHVAYEIDHLIDTFNALLSELQHAYHQVKQFGHNASHELKTPLTIIKGEIDVGLRKERSQEEYQTILANIATEVTHLQEVIEKILFLSANTSVDIKKLFEDVYVDEILLETIHEKTALAHEKEITLLLEQLIPFTKHGNAALLKIVFTNLLDNAIKYSPAHTTVHIALANRRLIIQDHGIGISTADQKHLFEQFYRAQNGKAYAQGSGLGLALVKTILDLHHIDIAMTSQENEGTTITLSF